MRFAMLALMITGAVRKAVPFITVAVAVACISGTEPDRGREPAAIEIARKGQAICPIGPAFPSCYGKCGSLVCSPIDPNACCSCDDGCVARNDCCCDFEEHCDPEPSTSCAGHCGGTSPDGCGCDAGCSGRGDCCDDFATACDSCTGFCGARAPAGCFCDALCTGFDDCCGDFTGVCLDWPKVVPQGGSGGGLVLAADSSESLYLAANVAGPWDAGGGAITTTQEDTLVVSWDALGALRWSTRLTSDGGRVTVRALKVSGNNLYAVGQFTGGTLRRNGTAILAKPSGSTTAAFAVTLNRNTGVSTWAATRTGFTQGSFNDAESDGPGNLITAGELSSFFRLGRFVSYTPTGGFRWQRPSGFIAPYQRLTLDSAATTYLLADSGGTYGISSYTSAGALRWSGAELVNGAFHDISVHSTAVFAVGVCSVGCKIDGISIADGGLVTNFQLADGARRLLMTYPSGTRFQRVDIEGSGRVTMLGRVAAGPVDMGGGDLGSPGRASVFTLTIHHGGTHVASRVIASTPASAVLEPSDLALANGTPRYASVSANAPLVVDGASHGTSGTWNGLVVRLP